MLIRILLIFITLELAMPVSKAIAQNNQGSMKQNFEVKKDSSVIIQPQAILITQSDTLKKPADTVHVHSPRKAALLSAVLPGAGQIYNRKYWKVGVLAAGTGALIYGLNFNQRNFKLFKTELIHRQQGKGEANLDLVKYSDSNLNELQEFYHRNRDLTIVGISLLYAINIIDATVDAHFFDFNINDDLSMRIRPEPVYSSILTMPVTGLGLTLRF